MIGLLDTTFPSTASGIFVDTSGFLARWLAREANHGKAAAAWQKIAGRPPCHDQSCCRPDTHAARAKGRYVFALEKADSILASSAREILCTTREDELDALAPFGNCSY